MNVAELGLLIDGCRDRGGCDISESRASISISGLNADDAKIIMDGVIELGWKWIGIDASETEFREDSLIDDLGPFRIVLTKPPLPSGHVGVLTVRGFEQMLDSSIDVGVWRIATLHGEFATYSSYFAPWETRSAFRELSPLTMKSPRKFVRDFTEPRKVVSDIRPWLLREGAWNADDAMFSAWASRAARASLYALFDEVEANPLSVVLRGPPRRSVPVPANNLLEVIGKEGFDRLQEAAVWVYEMASETEMRHPLMSAELSRLFMPAEATVASLRTQLVSAIEGAKTAYQLGMSKLSSDTLKMLTDLRKSVIDEASKVSDATRQLVGTVATALSVGIGMIAARVAAGAGGPLVGAVTVVITAYVLAAIWAGHKSIKLQNDVRAQWKSRTYGFMATADYEELVDGPAIKAANLFYSVAWAATFLIAALFIVVVWVIAIPLNK